MSADASMDNSGIADPNSRKPRNHLRGASARYKAIHAYLDANRPAIGHLIQGLFEIRTLPEAERLATMLASHCPNAEEAAIGFWELLSNAIEHGNLGINFNEKSALLLSDQYHAEIERRSAMEPYCRRVVQVQFRRLKSEIRILVTDEGEGFDFHAYGPGFRADTAPNGRGIALARQIAFSTLRYHENGQKVEARIKLKRAPRSSSK